MLAAEQLSRSSTEVRKEWSSAIDATVRVRPQFVQRTHDNITMLNTIMLAELMSNYKLHAVLYREPDGSYTASVDEMDVVENGDTKEELLSPVDGMVFTLREYPVVNEGSLIARILGGIGEKRKKAAASKANEAAGTAENNAGTAKDAAGSVKRTGGAGK